MIDRERCFRMSAVNALDRLQTYALAHPSLGLERCAAVLRAGLASASTFDYEQAIAIMRHCPAIVRIDDGPRVTRLRAIVSALVLHVGPSWKWLLPLGRRYLSGHLNPDAKQVFDVAGLYGSSDDPLVRAWWDAVAHSIRGESGESRMDLGRCGEDLTVEREKGILAGAGRGDLRIEPFGFEDNTLGYDVRSFTVAGGKVRPKYIEVKATERHPLRFYLSRNEWQAAERYGDDYFVHLWHLPSKELIEISFGQLSIHVPIDRGRGEWERAIINWE